MRERRGTVCIDHLLPFSSPLRWKSDEEETRWRETKIERRRTRKEDNQTRHVAKCASLADAKKQNYHRLWRPWLRSFFFLSLVCDEVNLSDRYHVYRLSARYRWYLVRSISAVQRIVRYSIKYARGAAYFIVTTSLINCIYIYIHLFASLSLSLSWVHRSITRRVVATVARILHDITTWWKSI